MLSTLFQLNLEEAGEAAPVPSIVAVSVPGTQVFFDADENITFGAGGPNGLTLTMSGGAVTLTYSSFGGGNLVYDTSRRILAVETGTISYTQPGDGIQGSSSGLDMESFSDFAVTNSSQALPEIVSATILADGEQIRFIFDGPVFIGAGGATGMAVSLSGGAATLTYVSGDETNTLIYSISRVVQYDETGSFSYTQPGNGLEDSAGTDVETFGESFSGPNSNDSEQGILVVGAQTLRQYISLYPGLTGGLSDKTAQFLEGEGFTEGSLNDRLFNWLADTYTPTTVSTMVKQWEADNL